MTWGNEDPEKQLNRSVCMGALMESGKSREDVIRQRRAEVVNRGKLSNICLFRSRCPSSSGVRLFLSSRYWEGTAPGGSVTCLASVESPCTCHVSNAFVLKWQVPNFGIACPEPHPPIFSSYSATLNFYSILSSHLPSIHEGILWGMVFTISYFETTV